MSMFRRQQIGDNLAYGAIPAYCKYELFMERYRHPAEFLGQTFMYRDAQTALDIGCGHGRLKVFFDQRCRLEWHGIDVSERSAEICASLGYAMRIHDIEKAPLPFDDETFDFVAGLHVLEHLNRPEKVVQEMGRVIKSGGILLLGVPTKPPVIAESIGAYYSMRQALRPKYGQTCNSYSASSFLRMLERSLGSQFRILDYRGFRLLSARKSLPLENNKLFHDINTWIGRRIPNITPEINVILEKRHCQQEELDEYEDPKDLRAAKLKEANAPVESLRPVRSALKI